MMPLFMLCRVGKKTQTTVMLWMQVYVEFFLLINNHGVAMFAGEKTTSLCGRDKKPGQRESWLTERAPTFLLTCMPSTCYITGVFLL
jgi:hypothetical protein